MALKHPFAPVFDARSRVLILGSFPSVASRANGFYYGHKQNRFWRVMACVLSVPVPETIEEKRAMLLTHGVALWDAAAACEIEGSLDAHMKNVVPNDLAPLFSAAPIRAVFLNGAEAYRLYESVRKSWEPSGIRLPSTSPANAAWSPDKLCAAWAEALAPFLCPSA